MTNEQLAVLLRMIEGLLREALEAVKSQLPDDFAEKRESVFGLSSIHYPALEPIEDVRERLVNCIERLTEEKK